MKVDDFKINKRFIVTPTGGWSYFHPIVQKRFPLLDKEAVRRSGSGEVIGYSTNPS